MPLELRNIFRPFSGFSDYTLNNLLKVANFPEKKISRGPHSTKESSAGRSYFKILLLINKKVLFKPKMW